MGILLGPDSRLVVQGGTGREGSFQTQTMLEYGTRVVGIVTPGRGGQQHLELPVFDTVAEAVREVGANASVGFIPAPGAADGIMEAAAAGIELIVCISDRMPVLDTLRAYYFVKNKGARLIGPNCPGVTTPGVGKAGIMPGNIFQKGPVGLISRSGTLTYEVVNLLTKAGLGQSTCVGIGGDPIVGSSFRDILGLFNDDDQTEVIVLLGEVGGAAEEEAAEWIAAHAKKPAVSFISGRTAPPGKRMGHAGAIISGNRGTAEAKVAAFQAAGVPLADTIEQIPALVKAAL
ncbi:MAG: succinate--CoA ligase subunit alpha [Chloroflexi bacterium]|nr:succinate--CoA ligase subunit alpha [Chloroflexota bacterium]